MKERDDITTLFRSRLSDAEMPVREGFWEELQSDLPVSGKGKLLYLPRLAAAASILLILGCASVVFWHFSPEREIKEAFTQVANLTPEVSPHGYGTENPFPVIHQPEPTQHRPMQTKPQAPRSAYVIPAALPAEKDMEEEEEVSVRVSITITERIENRNFRGNKALEHTGYSTTSAPETETSAETLPAETLHSAKDWSWKLAMGSSLPKEGFSAPLVVGASVERRLNKRLSLEAGLQYNRMEGKDNTLHTLGIPVKLNALLASSPKWDFYAQVGAAAEKCIAGAADNSFNAEPVLLSVDAGVGVRYKVNERVAFFAEHSVSHHFDADTASRSLRTERPTNLNLLCGVRMSY